MSIDEINILEQVTDTTAKQTTECIYPLCEKCDRYVSIGGVSSCSVPIVINKQIWLTTASKIRMVERCLAELQTAVYDHILEHGEPSEQTSTLVCENCVHHEEPEFCGFHKMKVAPGSYCNSGIFKP